MNNHEKTHILLVDDNAIDIEATKRAFIKQELHSKIHVASDGVVALKMLRGEGGHGQLPKPIIILLDINMPRMNGLEFLKELRSDSQLTSYIVFIVTTSCHEKDLKMAYELNVAGYFLKERLGRNYVHLAKMLQNYLEIAQLPS